jgi:O-acetyl-ADP-ribose deacetylase
MKAQVNKVTIQIAQGDIFSLPVQAVVNSTDPNLSLPKPLAVLAGATVERECSRIGWCEVGSAVITSGGTSAFAHIVHVVGPRWGEGAERGKLANATWECLRLTESKQAKSIAIPAISTGAFGYPLENCAATMLTQIIDYTFEEPKHLRKIIVCLDTPLAYEIFRREFARQVEELKNTGEGKVKV